MVEVLFWTVAVIFLAFMVNSFFFLVGTRYQWRVALDALWVIEIVLYVLMWVVTILVGLMAYSL